MQRRQLMATAGSTMAVAVAGCAGDSDSDTDNGSDATDDDNNTENTTSRSDNERYAENVIDVIDENLGVDHYAVDHDLDILFVDFFRSGNQTQDLQVVGGAFAGAVDAGLSIGALAADALNDDGSSDYIFDVERADAAAFMADEISEDEYLGRIEATIE